MPSRPLKLVLLSCHETERTETKTWGVISVHPPPCLHISGTKDTILQFNSWKHSLYQPSVVRLHCQVKALKSLTSQNRKHSVKCNAEKKIHNCQVTCGNNMTCPLSRSSTLFPRIKAVSVLGFHDQSFPSSVKSVNQLWVTELTVPNASRQLSACRNRSWIELHAGTNSSQLTDKSKSAHFKNRYRVSCVVLNVAF